MFVAYGLVAQWVRASVRNPKVMGSRPVILQSRCLTPRAWIQTSFLTAHCGEAKSWGGYHTQSLKYSASIYNI
jgi:hypothetical protein